MHAKAALTQYKCVETVLGLYKHIAAFCLVFESVSVLVHSGPLRYANTKKAPGMLKPAVFNVNTGTGQQLMN